MAKVTLTNLASLRNEPTALETINTNNDRLETAIEKTLSRDGTAPNEMNTYIDMNENKIVNLLEPDNPSDAATKYYVDQVAGSGVTGPPGLDGQDGTDGEDGVDGWTVVLGIEDDNERRVLKITDYIFGSGEKPPYVGQYIGANGPVASKASAVNIRGAQGTSGPGSGDLLAANNLSDIGNAATARTNLGLAIGTNVQAYNAKLASIAGLSGAADRVIYLTGANTAALATFTSYGRTLVANANSADARVDLNLVVGTDVQAYNANLAAIAGLSTTSDRLAYFTGSGTANITTFTSAARNLLDDADAATMRATLGGVALKSQGEMFAIVVPVVENKNIDVIISSQYPLTINKIKTVCQAGTCTVTGKIASTYNGSYTNLGGTANSASTTLTEQTHSSANSLSASGSFRLTITNATGCSDLTIQVECTRTFQ